MVRHARVALAICLALLLAAAGCLAGAPGRGGPAASPPTPSSGYRTATGTPDPLPGRADCADGLWVSFWGLGEPRLWEPHQVRYTASVPADTSVLFVAYVEGAASGAHAMSTRTGSGGLHVDGGAIEVPNDLHGEHAVRIVVHRDVDRDGSFDSGTDPPCYNGDGLVGTDYLVVDFDRYW